MNALIDDRNRRGKFLGQANYAGILPTSGMRDQEQAERLRTLVLPEVFAPRVQFVWLVVRVDGPPHNRDSQVSPFHAVSVFRVVDDGQTVSALAAVAGDINPALPGVFVTNVLPDSST